MRLTFEARHSDAYHGIELASERMVEYQRQVATGLRVQRPSDDAAAAATSIVERGALATIEQYTQASDSAESRLTVVDNVLSDMLDKITSARTTIMSVQGTGTTTSQRTAGSQQLASLRDAIFGGLNTAFRGTFLFGGATGLTVPYTKTPAGAVNPYAASTREVTLPIDRGQSVTIAFDGSTIAQGPDLEDVFTILEDALTATLAGDGATLQSSLDALGRAFERVTQAQSRVGANLRAIGDERLRLEDASLSSQTRVSKLEDANLAKAISGMQESQASYSAALGSATTVTQLSLFDYLR